MRRSTILYRTLLATAVTGTIRTARMVIIVCFAVCSVAVPDGWAQRATDQSTVPVDSTCDSHARFYRVQGAISDNGRSTYPMPMDLNATADIPVWKSITVGNHESGGALRSALNAAHCRVGDLAKEVLDGRELMVRKSRTEVDLAVVSAADLGSGAEGMSRAEIYRRAAQLGLGLCSAEVALQLRLQYANQPLGEFLQIAMEPVLTKNGDLAGLSLGNGGAGLLVIGGDAHPQRILSPTVRFVFVRHPTDRLPARS